MEEDLDAYLWLYNAPLARSYAARRSRPPIRVKQVGDATTAVDAYISDLINNAVLKIK